MKFVELKQKFILVLQLISQLENSSAFEYKKEAYNFENEKDLFRLKDKFIVPFLKCLPKALSDRKQRGQAKDICEENIRGLLVDTEIKDSLRALDVAHIALFEMMHQYLLGVESAEFSVLVQAIYDEIKLSKEDVGVLRCDALGHLNSHFKLDVLDSSKSDFSDELYRIGLSLNDCILELNEINCAKNNILKLKEDRDKTLQSQYAVLEEVAKLYIDGNGQEGLKRHDEAYFNKLFGSCLRFNGGNPEVMNKNDEFDFKGTLQTIILNCKRKRTLWARIWGKLQAGKTVALLLRKAQEVSSNTGLEVTSGDIRKREPVVAVWVDVNPTERAAKILRLELDYDNKHKHKENQLPGEIRKWKDRKAAAIDKFSEKVKSYGEALKKAFNFRQSFRALVQNAEKKALLQEG
ncbi:hypothetical protein [Piscirickettsia salmonis]|uniref:hypothetical protein n=1 Tax=Piscirickettsia salmonis TaxID=1238 RepID=UPI00166262D3|nr:hypothetical protein [Piscirickettsia salmonis]QNR79498.1 hypothetical protein ICC15_10620 [Piscirickettsia salmonis]QNR82184.1 hypothetical protein ICC15_16830 [Piscirickettsia salmonis]